MSQSELAEKETVATWKIIEQFIGNTVRPTRSSWRITIDKKCFVAVKFSIYHKKPKQFFYGVNPKDIEEGLKYEHSYIVFIVDNHQELLIVPVNELDFYIKKSNLTISDKKQIKLHIVSENGKYSFIEFRDFDISKFNYVKGAEIKNSVNPFNFEGNSVNKLISRIEDEVKFNPQNVIDARERIFTSIAVRRGQQKFRRSLIEAYEGRCAITGCEIQEILEAAHITPYKGEHTNKLANGLLLRSDLHTLFDLGFMAVDTNTMSVILLSSLIGTEYEKFQGKKLIAKSNILQNIKDALDEHRINFFHN